MSRIVLFLALVAAALSATARGELLPAEIAIMAARGNSQSEELAKYYASARQVPAGQICLVDLPAGDECSRDAWSSQIRPAIRAWLAEHDPDHKLRCVVTVWGVPLKIGAAEPTDALQKYEEFLVGERRAQSARVYATVKEFEAIAPAGELSTDAVGQPSTGAGGGKPGAAPPSPGTPDELKWLQARLDESLKAAQSRIGALPEGPARLDAQNRLQQLITGVGGATIILQSLQKQINGQNDHDSAILAEFQRIRGAGAAWVEARQVLEKRPPSIERDASILPIVDRIGGAIATVAWLDDQIAIAKKNETAAAFDSELALVLWDDGYELLRWQPNYLRKTYDGSYLRTAFPTVMTARLDAPTPELARGLVDAAVEAERKGLAGKAYIDSRGLGKGALPLTTPSQAEAADFDRVLLGTAQAIKDKTTVEVVVNDQPALFAPGECPDVAIYWGWYSLGKYVDVFEFKKGALAIHIAGDEANGLHDTNSQRWCKRLLEDGAAATIGAVFEPHLAAYPRPDEFLGLLLSGNQTLAECYWQAQPFTSWSLILIGDPLYRPFKNRDVGRSKPAIREPGK